MFQLQPQHMLKSYIHYCTNENVFAFPGQITNILFMFSYWMHFFPFGFIECVCWDLYVAFNVIERVPVSLLVTKLSGFSWTVCKQYSFLSVVNTILALLHMLVFKYTHSKTVSFQVQRLDDDAELFFLFTQIYVEAANMYCFLFKLVLFSPRFWRLRNKLPFLFLLPGP